MIEAVRTAITERIKSIQATIDELMIEQETLLNTLDEARKIDKPASPANRVRKKRKYTMTNRATPNQDIVLKYMLGIDRALAAPSIAAALSDDINPKSIYSALYGLQKRGKVARDDEKKWYVTQHVREAHEEEQTAPPSSPNGRGGIAPRGVRIHVPGH
jgi:hypothetical protein